MGNDVNRPVHGASITAFSFNGQVFKGKSFRQIVKEHGACSFVRGFLGSESSTIETNYEFLFLSMTLRAPSISISVGDMVAFNLGFLEN